MTDAPAAIRRVIKHIMKQNQSTLSKKHSRCSFLNSSKSRSPSSSLKSSSLILLCVTLLTNAWNQGFSQSFVSSLCSHKQTFQRFINASINKITFFLHKVTFEIASYDSEKLYDDQYNEENKSCRGIDSFLKWRQQILEDVKVDVGCQEKSDLETKFFTRCN